MDPTGLGLGVLLGFIFTLIGWIVTHRLSLKAERRLLLDRVVHEAAQQVVSTIREHSYWLGRVHMALIDLRWIDRLPEERSPAKWLEAADRLRQHVFAASTAWIFVLEGFETLFPETSACRVELEHRERDMVERARAVAIDVLLPSKRFPALERAEKLGNEFLTEQALFDDLRRHIQHTALTKITGYKIPTPVPREQTVPKLVLGSDDKLHIQRAAA
jgi:hypothetical protein